VVHSQRKQIVSGFSKDVVVRLAAAESDKKNRIKKGVRVSGVSDLLVHVDS